MRDARGERSVIRVHRAATHASTNSASSVTSGCGAGRISSRHLGSRCAVPKLKCGAAAGRREGTTLDSRAL